MTHRYASSRFTNVFRLGHLATLMGLSGGWFATPVTAQVTGVNYTVSGLGTRLFWDEGAGLDDGFVYGGELGVGFGESLELSGLYLFGTDFEIDYSGLASDETLRAALTGMLPRRMDVRRFGARLRLNVGSFRFSLGRGKVVPFISGGTGLIRFVPDDLDRSENIYVDVGVGFAVGLADRYTLSLAAENLIYRYHPGTTFFSEDDLAAVDLTPDRFDQRTAYNPAATLAMKVYLGGRAPGELSDVDRAFRQQFRGDHFSLALEPFYGQIDFNDALDFPESQAVGGLGVGIDLGAFIGLRAFYWQATNEASILEDGLPDDTNDLQIYGSELNLSFGREIRGVSPYLLLGGGYIDVGGDYGDQVGIQSESRYFAIGGLGMEIPLSSSLKLQGNVRSLLMSTEGVEDVSQPDNVFASFMYSVGVNFHLGGGGQGEDAMGKAVASARAESRDRDAAMERELARLQARLDSLEAVQAMPAGAAATEPPAPLLRADTLVVEGDTVVVMRETAPVGVARSNLSGQTITVPVPEKGEIYIRFGEPEAPHIETIYAPPMVVTLGRGDSTGAGGLTADQIRALIRQEMQALEQPLPDGQALTPEELAVNLRAMEERLERRLAEETNRLRAEQNQASRVGRQDDTVERGDEPPSGQARTTSTVGSRELEAVSPYVGFRVGAGPSQVLVGARGHYRFAGRRLRFMPELALGFGDGTSISAVANAVLPLSPGGPINPYGGAGVGLLSDAGVSGLGLALNLFGGVAYTFGNGMTFFAEFSTLDFGDFSRVLAGYRIPF